MRIERRAEDIEFLDRVENAWRLGYTQNQIAKAEDLSGSNSLHAKLNRLGFRFERLGGLRLVGTETGRAYAEMRAAGEIITPDLDPVGAL